MVNVFTGSKLWGGLFGDAPVAEAFSDGNVIEHLRAFEIAWTRGLATTGQISQASAQRVCAVLADAQIDAQVLGEGSLRDGVPVVALVSHFRQAVPPEMAQSSVHRGATSQDVIDTAFAMICSTILRAFVGRLTEIAEQLDRLQDTFGPRPLMGRTRMQAAHAITVADRLRTWRGPVADRLAELDGVIDAISTVQVGGPVGVRDGALDRMAQALAADLGLRCGPVWHTDRARFVAVGHWCVATSGSLGKLGKDLCLMAQQGVEEVTFAGAGASSAMPHKQNPIRAEILVALAQYVAGQQGILGHAMVHEQERSGAAWALEWLVLPAMLEATGAALTHACVALSRITDLGTPSGTLPN